MDPNQWFGDDVALIGRTRIGVEVDTPRPPMSCLPIDAGS